MTDAERTGAQAGAGPTIGVEAEEASLRRIIPRLPESAYTLVGPGDDGALLRAPDGRYVVTTDMMVHGPDFRLAWSEPHDLGWKAAATNLSDVAAMGARPTALLIAIAAPVDLPVAHLEGIADGLRDACTTLAPGCGVVGGDLSVSDVLTIAVTAFGDLEGRPPVLRSGSRVGDIVAATGELGLAGRGLRLLFSEGIDANGAPDRTRAEALRRTHPIAIEAQLAPSPDIGAGVEAALAGARAMMDLSDGLVLDGCRLAAASGVCLDIESALLGADPESALEGGEDHGLLACFPPEAQLPPGFRRIGRVVAGEGLRLDGRLRASTGSDTGAGWDPYRGWDGQAG